MTTVSPSLFRINTDDSSMSCNTREEPTLIPSSNIAARREIRNYHTMMVAYTATLYERIKPCQRSSQTPYHNQPSDYAPADRTSNKLSNSAISRSRSEVSFGRMVAKTFSPMKSMQRRQMSMTEAPTISSSKEVKLWDLDTALGGMYISDSEHSDDDSMEMEL